MKFKVPLLCILWNVLMIFQASVLGVEDGSKKKEAGSASKSGSARLLGMGVSEGGIGFEKAFSLAREVGVGMVEISVPWDESEIQPGKYSNAWLPIANAYYPTTRTRISITLNPIDTHLSRLPKDLKEKPFNDPVVIERYKAFVGQMAGLVKDSDVFYVAIGNEIDVYLGDSKKRWEEYGEFFLAVAPFVREKFPKAVVGSKITFDGLTSHPSLVKKLVDGSDLLLLTYYPFKSGGFLVRAPSAVHEDFQRVTEAWPGKKVCFAEIGYPSGVANGSSEEQQAEFIRESFKAWDRYAERMPLLNFLWMHDVSPKEVDDYKNYYGVKDPGFASFLGTLGLRTHDGKDKRAFLVFREESGKRKWK